MRIMVEIKINISCYFPGGCGNKYEIIDIHEVIEIVSQIVAIARDQIKLLCIIENDN